MRSTCLRRALLSENACAEFVWMMSKLHLQDAEIPCEKMQRLKQSHQTLRNSKSLIIRRYIVNELALLIPTKSVTPCVFKAFHLGYKVSSTLL